MLSRFPRVDSCDASARVKCVSSVPQVSPYSLDGRLILRAVWVCFRDVCRFRFPASGAPPLAGAMSSSIFVLFSIGSSCVERILGVFFRVIPACGKTCASRAFPFLQLWRVRNLRVAFCSFALPAPFVAVRALYADSSRSVFFSHALPSSCCFSAAFRSACLLWL